MRRGALTRIAMTFAGLALALYGVFAAVSPFPVGLPLLVVGLLMIAAANPAARPFILRLRRRWRWFDKLVRIAGSRGPERVKFVVEETDPSVKEKADPPDGELSRPAKEGT